MTLRPGDTLGPYKIASLVGKGGMGEVYQAQDTRLDRLVAIKVSTTEFSERFEREARAVASLNHPNICTLHDIATAPGKFGYLVMEFIDGHPVQGPLPVDRALHFAVQIADALTAAHAKGIVHRDLKPANVLVTGDGRIKVLDFGLATIDASLDPEGATRAMVITNPGTTVGTVAYMSPEQTRGQAVDARTDLWSFGVMLYEMVTGVRPFEGATPAVLFDAILNRAPVPARERNPKVPSELEHIIARLLEKDRETRYQSAADLRADLKRVERDSSGSLTPASGHLPVTHSAATSRSRWTYGIAALGLVAVAGAGLFVWQQTMSAPVAETDTLVLADFTNTTGDPVFDGTLREALSVQIDASPYLKTMPESQLRQALQRMGRTGTDRVTNEVAGEICQREGLKATISGSIASLGKRYAIALQATNCQSQDTIAREQIEAEDKDHVLQAVAQAAQAIRKTLGESLSSIERVSQSDADKVTTSSLEAFEAYAMGAQEFRKGTVLASIPLMKRATELDPNFASAWYYLGAATAVSGAGSAPEYYAKAYELRDRVSERERLTIEAFYFQSLQQWDKFGDATAIWARSYSRWALPHNMRGFYHRALGELEDALSSFQEAYRLEQTTAYVANVARDYARLNRFDEARTVVEKAIAEGLPSADLHGLLLTNGYLQGDRVVVDRERQWFAGKPEEYVGLGLQAGEALMRGQFAASADLRRRAADSARRQNVAAAAATFSAPDFLSEAWLDNCQAARSGPVPLAVALCADAAQAEALIDATTTRQPLSTLWSSIRQPIVRAAIELRRDQPDKAIELLAPIQHYERSYPEAIYLRGLAYSRAGKPRDAAAEFQKLIGLRGVTWGTLYAPLAYVGAARAASAAGDVADAKQFYERFFDLWKDAGKDIPLLVSARREYAAL